MTFRFCFLLACDLVWLGPAVAHPWKAGEASVFDEAFRAHLVADWVAKQKPDDVGEIKPLRVAAASGKGLNLAAAAMETLKNAPSQSLPFQAFPKVEIQWDKDWLFIGSNGLPDHGMMVGITAWQQQVPLPQRYFGSNAWQIPRHPVPAKRPVSIKGNFLRGAIALAVNGIPIFNPQNNRGEISQEIGELDQWGGHCGRADDYHYHAAPLHLQAVVGKDMPIAYALDGYPIYGLAEPDGMPTGKLDEFNGHETGKLGYHYHASTKYPYVNGGFHGEVTEAGGQVDPQPRAQPIRPDKQPLRGAEITGFESVGSQGYKLTYTVNGQQRSIAYRINSDGSYPFEFDNGSEGKIQEVYRAREGAGGSGDSEEPVGQRRGRDRAQKDRPEKEGLRPPVLEPIGIVASVAKPNLDENEDGKVSAVEFAAAAKREFAAGKEGLSLTEVMEKARASFIALDSNRDGLLDAKEREPAPANAKVGKVTTDFVLTSPVVQDGGNLPLDYTGDGSGATLPLAWKGAPAGTRSYAIIMDHLAPGNEMKSYWILWDIPAHITSLTRNVRGIGKLGVGFRGEVGYEPPHSKGPGAKTYVLHVYALSAEPKMKEPASQVNREMLLAAMQGDILATADLHVVYARSEGPDNRGAGATGGSPPAPDRGEAAGLGGGEGRQRKPWLQMHAKELEADGDGSVTLAELTADMRRAITLYDASEDEIITPTEIDAAGDIRDGAAFAGMIYRHAIDLDANGDSRLTKNELMDVVKYILTTADRDGDGKVSAAEVESAPNAPLPIPAAFDSNGSAAAEVTPSAMAPAQSGKPKVSSEKGDSGALVKPDLSDTVKLNVYADNWFMLYVNGRVVAVDPIQFTPHNVVSVDFLPEYPMTLAILAKDNADPKTGMEYGNQIGDGGFILKFADGTVTNATWKAKSFFQGPLNGDTRSPQVKLESLPVNWWTVDFDDREWPAAKEYRVEEVNPKKPYFENDFEGAKFIWTQDLALDNTVIFRTRIEKPGWKPRWNTKPDLDVTGIPVR